MNAVVRAIDKLGYNQDEVCIVSGIGCSSRATGLWILIHCIQPMGGH